MLAVLCSVWSFAASTELVLALGGLLLDLTVKSTSELPAKGSGVGLIAFRR